MTATTREPRPPRFVFQDKAECPGCKNADVDVVSLDTEPGLLWSRHFVDRRSNATYAFCEWSGSEYERPRPGVRPKKTGTHGR